MRLDYLMHRFEFPFKDPPAWASSIDRWYQMDAPAFGLVDGFYALAENWQKPDLLYVCSPAASNATDRLFVESKLSSPSLFVHTLPSVRSSFLLSAMKWRGPMMCLQRDPSTVVLGIEEALSFVKNTGEMAWLTSVRAAEGLPNQFFSLFIRIGPTEKNWGFEVEEIPESVPGARNDADLYRWLLDSEGTSGFELVRHRISSRAV